jgi:hypothetical protein
VSLRKRINKFVRTHRRSYDVHLSDNCSPFIAPGGCAGGGSFAPTFREAFRGQCSRRGGSGRRHQDERRDTPVPIGITLSGALPVHGSDSDKTYTLRPPVADRAVFEVHTLM